MCGRFANRYSVDQLKQRYQAVADGIAYDPSYNIAPTEQAPILVETGKERALWLAGFGIPMQAGGKRFPLLNIKSEKAGNRRDFQQRRCIVPASGFYEWEKQGPKDKRPHYFSAVEEEPLAFAGIWQKQGGQAAFSILTTRANELVGTIHGRMPVILGHNALGAWLNPHATKEELMEMMQPYAPARMQEWEVSKTVNSPKNKQAACINSL